MAQDEKTEEPRPRRRYAAPELLKVPVRAEEAVLGGCKTTLGLGPGSDCITLNCRDMGS